MLCWHQGFGGITPMKGRDYVVSHYMKIPQSTPPHVSCRVEVSIEGELTISNAVVDSIIICYYVIVY